MRKEKSKRHPFPTRLILIASVWLLGMMCVFVFLRPAVEPFTVPSTPLPTTEPYHLTGTSYLSDWDEDITSPSIDANGLNVASFDQRRYTKPSLSPLAIAQIIFIQFKTIKPVRDAFYSQVFPAWFIVIEDAIHIETLKADHFRVACHTLKPSSPEETATSNYPSCNFMARYGLCVIEVSSTIHEPNVTPNHFKQLIMENIDPQMAAWDVCYPNRQAG